MTSSVSTGSSLFLLVLAAILLPAYGRYVGEKCSINGLSNAGICKRLRDCSIVYQELLTGKEPSETCGFVGFEPIVCCPTNPTPNQPTMTSSTPKTTDVPIKTVRPLTFDPEIRGSLARAKCAENAKAVYGFEVSQSQAVDQPLVNVSLCALKTNKLIIGGERAEQKEFPHMAAVGFVSDNNILWQCGGSLISAKIVLTAAHCTYSNNWGKAQYVRLGILTLAQTREQRGSQTIRIEERIRHPRYKSPSEYHDIAILRLEKEVTYNAWVRPACLPVDLPDEGDDNKAVATGWGLVDWYDETGSEDLLKVTLNLVPHENCNRSFSDGNDNVQLPKGIINELQICAGEVGKDTCQGDSGGPLAVFNKNHGCMYNVIGITSLGKFCGSIIPGVYTRVYYYIPWIERTAWPEYFTNI